MTLTNDEFTDALRYRYMLKPVYHIDGTTCACGKILDQYGIHLATCCPIGSHRFKTHDSIKYEINNILRYCGLWTKVEDPEAFTAVDPMQFTPRYNGLQQP